MELRNLRYFAEVVAAGSLTAAAAQLHMRQPSLSAAITKLERDVGVQLLVRSTRGAEPTSAGRYLLDAGTRLLGDVEEVERTLARYGSGLAGSLSLAAVPVLMWHRIPVLLRSYAQDAPDVEVRLVDPPPWNAIDMLHAGRADLAAIVVADLERFSSRHQEQFEILDWGEIPLMAVLPPGYDELPDPLPLTYLEGKQLLLPRKTAAVPSLPEVVEDALRENAIAVAEVRTVETIQSGIPLIEAGLAIGILPDPDLASLRRFNVTLRAITPAMNPLRAVVLVRREKRREVALSRLLNLITLVPENRV